MKSSILKYLLLLIALLSSISLGFSSTVFELFSDVSIIFQNMGPEVAYFISFVLLTVLFFVIFKQGTVRMLPNNSRGAKAVAVILGLFAAIGLVTHERLANTDNVLIAIGQGVLFPVLLLALFAGSWAVLRGINGAKVSGFGKILMYLGFLVLFTFAFIQLMIFGGATLFSGIIQTDFVQGIISFFTYLLIVLTIIFVVALIFIFFTVKEFLELFDSSDDESVLARARKKKKEKKIQDANTIEQLNQLKKAFQKMKNAYDDKAVHLRDIGNMGDIRTTLDRAEEVPPQDTDGRGLYKAPQNFGGPFK
ncbi:MAG: hypothetical protein LAT82_01160 [Nanoarchaeota archaeon]|nr:hypothetical protein [Nanoarchaeota archaeon]